jgi:DNA polymerase III subunit epsilon
MTAVDPSVVQAYRKAPQPAGRSPWREAEYSVIDLELTGLDPSLHEIVSFACVTVARGRVRLHDARDGTVRPRRMPDPDTIRIHGLRETDLADAPSLDQVLEVILAAITGRVLVAHVAAIETSFLRAALENRGVQLENPVVDTASLGVELRRLRGEPPLGRDGDQPARVAVSSPGLPVLARSLGLPVHRPHHADGDALTTAQVFIALASHLEAFSDPLTVGALVRISEQDRANRGPGLIHRSIGRLRP